jgi:hypothetical protein
VVLADLRSENAMAAAMTLSEAGFETSTACVDVPSRSPEEGLVSQATGFGSVTGLIHAAGVSLLRKPTDDPQGQPLRHRRRARAFRRGDGGGAAGLLIASHSGHLLPALTTEQDRELATTPADELLDLSWLQPNLVTDTLHALPVLQARQLAAGYGRARTLGQARRVDQHD